MDPTIPDHVQGWPLRYRLAHRAHCHANRLHRAIGNDLTWWLNCKLGSLWINWWIQRAHREERVEPMADRLTPFGVIDKYLYDEPFPWSSFHAQRIIERLEAEGYKIVNADVPNTR